MVQRENYTLYFDVGIFNIYFIKTVHLFIKHETALEKAIDQVQVSLICQSAAQTRVTVN